MEDILVHKSMKQYAFLTVLYRKMWEICTQSKDYIQLKMWKIY